MTEKITIAALSCAEMAAADIYYSDKKMVVINPGETAFGINNNGTGTIYAWVKK